MQQLISICLLLFFMFAQNQSFAQNGKMDVRIVKNYYSCDSLFMFADIEIKANDDTTIFNVADLNVRISFNRDAFHEGTMTNPSVTIEQELTLSGLVSGPGYTAFYNPHTVTGSLDTVISYNIELAGGDGYPVEETTWVPVGRFKLMVKDPNACSDIWVHDIDPINFPPTFASELFNSILYQVDEGDYTNQQSCFPALCNQPPVAIDDYITTSEGMPITYNLLTNDSDPDNNLSPASLTLVSTPPTSEMTVATGPGAGEITITPTAIWYGTGTPFSYQVCDDAGACTSAFVYVTVLDDTQTSVTNLLKDRSLTVYPTLTSDQVTVSFEDGWNRDDNITVKLYSMLGRVISTENIYVSGNGHTYQTSLEALPPGAYFLSLSNGAATYTERIIKQ